MALFSKGKGGYFSLFSFPFRFFCFARYLAQINHWSPWFPRELHGASSARDRLPMTRSASSDRWVERSSHRTPWIVTGSPIPRDDMENDHETISHGLFRSDLITDGWLTRAIRKSSSVPRRYEVLTEWLAASLNSMRAGCIGRALSLRREIESLSRAFVLTLVLARAFRKPPRRRER